MKELCGASCGERRKEKKATLKEKNDEDGRARAVGDPTAIELASATDSRQSRAIAPRGPGLLAG